jgi:hypothetical protein
MGIFFLFIDDLDLTFPIVGMLLFIGLAGLASLRFVETPQDADWITEREFIEEESEKVISFIFLIISLILWIREPSNYASWGIVIGVIMVLHSMFQFFLSDRGVIYISIGRRVDILEHKVVQCLPLLFY